MCAVDQKRPFFPRAGPFLDLLPLIHSLETWAFQQTWAFRFWGFHFDIRYTYIYIHTHIMHTCARAQKQTLGKNQTEQHALGKTCIFRPWFIGSLCMLVLRGACCAVVQHVRKIKRNYVHWTYTCHVCNLLFAKLASKNARPPKLGARQKCQAEHLMYPQQARWRRSLAVQALSTGSVGRKAQKV